MGPVLIAILIVVAIIIIGGIVSYNRFVQQKNLIKDAWANIDTELRRRYDLIPNLVETVRGYATHEREVFENVTRARAAATSATGSPGEQAAAEGPLVAALRQLFAVVENYPDLKANQNFLALQSELSNTEDRLQTARRFYNANVREYNQRVQSFPSMLVARMFTFQEEEFFEVDEALRGDAGVPKVDFTGATPGVSFGDGASPPPAAPPTAPQPATSPAPSPPAPGPEAAGSPPERPRLRPPPLPALPRRRRRTDPRPRRRLPEAYSTARGSGPTGSSGASPHPSKMGVRRTSRVSTNQTPVQPNAIPPTIMMAGRGPSTSARYPASTLETPSVRVTSAKSNAKIRPRIQVRHQALEAVGREHPLGPTAEVGDQVDQRREPQGGHHAHRHVTEAEEGHRARDGREQSRMVRARQPMADERPYECADSPRGHEQAEPDVAGVEHALGEHGDQR